MSLRAFVWFMLSLVVACLVMALNGEAARGLVLLGFVIVISILRALCERI